MSDISKQLLSKIPLYQHLVPYFKSVPIDQPFTLTIQSNDPVQAKKKEGGRVKIRLERLAKNEWFRCFQISKV